MEGSSPSILWFSYLSFYGSPLLQMFRRHSFEALWVGMLNCLITTRSYPFTPLYLTFVKELWEKRRVREGKGPVIFSLSFSFLDQCIWCRDYLMQMKWNVIMGYLLVALVFNIHILPNSIVHSNNYVCSKCISVHSIYRLKNLKINSNKT